MGTREIEPPPPGAPGLDVPVWLWLVLAVMWVAFVWLAPKDDSGEDQGWYILPSIISIVSLVGVTWLGL